MVICVSTRCSSLGDSLVFQRIFQFFGYWGKESSVRSVFYILQDFLRNALAVALLRVHGSQLAFAVLKRRVDRVLHEEVCEKLFPAKTLYAVDILTGII